MTRLRDIHGPGFTQAEYLRALAAGNPHGVYWLNVSGDRGRDESRLLVVTELGLTGRVQVVRARAEDIVRGRGPVTSLRARVVTARAVAPLERLAGWTVPLVQPGGELLALKGRSAAEEIEASRSVLERLGIVEVAIVECGEGLVDPATIVVRAVKAG